MGQFRVHQATITEGLSLLPLRGIVAKYTYVSGTQRIPLELPLDSSCHRVPYFIYSRQPWFPLSVVILVCNAPHCLYIRKNQCTPSVQKYLSEEWMYLDVFQFQIHPFLCISPMSISGWREYVRIIELQIEFQPILKSIARPEIMQAVVLPK